MPARNLQTPPQTAERFLTTWQTLAG
jgi:hypothetical protein